MVVLVIELGDVVVWFVYEVGVIVGGFVVGFKVEFIVGLIEGEVQIGVVLVIWVGIVGVYVFSKLVVFGLEVDDCCFEVVILGDLFGDVLVFVGCQVDGIKVLWCGWKIVEFGEFL